MNQISFSSSSLGSYHKEDYDLIGKLINFSSERKENSIKCIPIAEENHLSNIQSLAKLEKVQEMHSNISFKCISSKNSLIFEESGGDVGEGQGLHYGSFHDALLDEWSIEDVICKNYIYYN
ncbi:hypothetical protein SteCoe_24379 [Stentor coeruleus]|uniref:Uncharacterized protein n=1 Tax=Stentor coeruleus TaxID=5963 RepID=A0A1R2BHM9_9CILI|nr:hypothetical protein SteCoe_24379 [Stentor coeruleus]